MLGSEGVGNFVEVSITWVLFGEAPVDCDDARRSWHLEFEVGVVWNLHELRECWTSQYGVVLRLLVEHLELEDLSCKVALVAEDDVELDCSEGGGCFAWDYTIYIGA